MNLLCIDLTLSKRETFEISVDLKRIRTVRELRLFISSVYNMDSSRMTFFYEGKGLVSDFYLRKLKEGSRRVSLEIKRRKKPKIDVLVQYKNKSVWIGVSPDDSIGHLQEQAASLLHIRNIRFYYKNNLMDNALKFKHYLVEDFAIIKAAKEESVIRCATTGNNFVQTAALKMTSK